MVDLPDPDRLRRPAYTGENRCLPCTIVNGGLVLLAVVALAVAGRPRVAAAGAVGGAATIWLRGYLVPYTPRFAPRLAVHLPGSGALFDHADDSPPDGLATGTSPESDRPAGDAVVDALLEAGVVVPAGDGGRDTDDDRDGGDLTLADSFRDAWRREMATLRDRDPAELAAVADDCTGPAVEARASRGWDGRRSAVVLEGSGGVVSLEYGIAVAELAAARALESRIEDRSIRLAAGRPLRSLLAACPLCDGELAISRSSCCGEVTPIGSTPSEKLVCPDCDVRFFTYGGADD